MEVKQTHITIEKDKIEQVIQWAEKHGEIVFAGGGMDAVDSMNVFVESLRRSVAKAEKQEPVAHLKLMMEHSAWEGRLELSDALANIDEFYTHPQLKREPLTDEQWQVMADTLDCAITRRQKDVIEAAHGIKENT